jgi:endo-1,4-beta-xylanase
MKHTFKILGAFIFLSMFAASCADDDIENIAVDKPGSVAELEYLNDYDALKSYVDRSSNPIFKLGAGVTASDYIQKGSYYRWINENFDMVTAGNAMKYASVVGDNGAMNFGTVMQFVSAAKEAGIEIYGHTLLWHAQQNKKYLENLIKDKIIAEKSWRELITNNDIEGADVKNFYSTEVTDGPKPATIGEEGTGYNGGKAIVVQSGDAPGNEWDTQFFVTVPDFIFKAGDHFKFSMKYRAEKPASGPSQAHFEPGQYNHYSFVGTLNFTTEWQTHEFDGYIDAAQEGENGVKTIAFNLAVLPETNTYYFDDISWQVEEVPGGSIPVIVYENDFSNTPLGGWGNNSTREIVDGAMVMTNPSAVNFWEAQTAYDFPTPLTEGTVYFLKFKVKGSGEGTLRQGFQFPGNYSSGGDFASVNFNTEWQEFTLQTAVTRNDATRFLFSFGDFAGSIYIDDLQIYYEKPGGIIELTPEEKADTLSWALENWISGMMTATDGYVKHWDVVNEPISGADTDGDGFYDLWSKENVSETDATNNFYWGDYLGDDYVRLAVKLARQYGPADMKLFVNDYNLESDWDDNHKLKSLIHWIERWESDGETVIDGIGTQMHISYYMDPATQASKEAHIVKMFELMAETGKLVRITELDMGIVDETGKTTLKTNELTEAHHKLMSDYYKFIVDKYIEIIPASQRAGITLWCPIDSPASSSWRGGEPTGLWSQNTKRKHTYAGFADGLAGK